MASKTPPTKSLGTVLVIGGCGFLGSSVVDQLLNFPSEDTPITISSTTTQKGKEKGKGNASPSLFPTLRSRYPSYTSTPVHALDLRCTRNLHPGCTYHEADITSPTELLALFTDIKPDVIINTASPPWNGPPDLLRKVNITGTRTLLEVAAGVHGDWGGVCKAFVHTSSASVIHDSVSDLVNADETYPYVCPNPVEYYSETKAIAEGIVLDANRKEGFNGLLTCAVRPAGIVGENDRSGYTYGVLTTAAIAPDWQLHFQLGEGGNLWDFTYVGNVVLGHLLAAEALVKTYQRERSGGAKPLDSEMVDGEAFIVTNDQPAYFWDVSRFLWTQYGRKVDTSKVWGMPEGMASAVGAAAEGWGWISGRKGKLTRQSVKYACMNRYYSCEKLKRRCGYKPVVGIEEGLGRAVGWFKGEEVEVEQKKGQ